MKGNNQSNCRVANVIFYTLNDRDMLRATLVWWCDKECYEKALGDIKCEIKINVLIISDQIDTRQK